MLVRITTKAVGYVLGLVSLMVAIILWCWSERQPSMKSVVAEGRSDSERRGYWEVSEGRDSVTFVARGFEIMPHPRPAASLQGTTPTGPPCA